MVGVYGLGIGVFQRILIWLYSGPVGSGVSVGGQFRPYLTPYTQSLYARARTMIVSKMPFY